MRPPLCSQLSVAEVFFFVGTPTSSSLHFWAFSGHDLMNITEGKSAICVEDRGNIRLQLRRDFLIL